MAYQMLQSLERVCRLNIDNDPEMIIVAAGAESPAAFGDAVIVGFRQGKETTGQLTGGDHQFIHGGLNLVCGNAVFRFPLGGVFLQGAVISTLGEKLLQLCTPFL